MAGVSMVTRSFNYKTQTNRGADKTLVFVRHGLTDWNQEQRFQGQLDVPLNTQGRVQAESLRNHFAHMTFDAVYSSPLQRALETALIIASDLPVRTESRISEIHHGAWQGRTKTEIARKWPDSWKRWDTDPQSFTPERGESLAQVRSRVEQFLHTVAGKTILCVSHGVVIQTVRSILLDIPRPEQNAYAPSNGSAHTFFFREDQVVDYRIEEIW